MSEIPIPTPRTDAVAMDGWSGDAECVEADFVRQLERELAVANARIADAVKTLDSIKSQSHFFGNCACSLLACECIARIGSYNKQGE